MLGTLCSSLLLLGASAVVGQAAFALCGRRRWTPLSPAVGLAALLAVAWGAVRLPGEGAAAAIALGVLLVAGLLVLRGRLEGLGTAARVELPVAAVALLLAALPFIVEARFGILGTGLNPDMSQHLFAADRLSGGGTERLIADGYPLGPHAVAVALSAVGPSLVEAFNGLTVATAISACLAALAALQGLSVSRRIAGGLVVGFAYLIASSYVQGTFKETLQALFLLAFAIGLHELARARLTEGTGRSALRAVPLAVLAIGGAYAYSFPGLAWLAGAAGVWAAIELGRVARSKGRAAVLGAVRTALPPALAALAVFCLAAAPEIPRMVSFASFETFDPDGAGLGNLFDRLSPLEALGIWPSGDFRVEPGAGAVPAALFYLGAALGLAALGFGVAWSLRRGETALTAALAAATALWLFSLVAGTPYQEAKALVLAAPLVAAISVRALLAGARAPAAVAFCLAAGGSAALALANGPVGPREYSPELAELRPELGPGSVLVLAPPELLDEQHGLDYLLWELRGNRVCVERITAVNAFPRPGISTQVLIAPGAAVEPEGILRNPSTASGPGPCPKIPDGARADPSAGE